MSPVDLLEPRIRQFLHPARIATHAGIDSTDRHIDGHEGDDALRARATDAPNEPLVHRLVRRQLIQARVFYNQLRNTRQAR